MKLKSLLFQLTVIVLGIIQSINAEKRLRFQIKDIKAWSDNNRVNFTYSIDQSIPRADIATKILKSINDVDFEIQINGIVKNNQNHFFHVNGSYNFCHLLSLKNASPITMLLFAHIKSFAHIPESCPIQKDTYSMKKIWPDDQSAKLKLPEMEFTAVVKASSIESNNRILIMELNVSGETVYIDASGDSLNSLRKKGILSVLNG